MSFRERLAWISLVCLVLTFGVFFLAMGHGFIPTHSLVTLQWFAACVAAFAVLRVALHVIAVVAAPSDARAPFDERERLISLKATRNANIALMAGVLIIPGSLHVGAHAATMGYLAMLALVVAEGVRDVSRITYSRAAQ